MLATLTAPFFFVARLRDRWPEYVAVAICAAAFITALTMAVVHVQAGPWLNLLGPVTFYLVAARLAGRGAALSALVIFLFVNGSTGWSRDHGTYSPWLFASNFAQGLFYLGALALLRARDNPTMRMAAVVGVIAGLAFLAHTSGALILVLLIVTTLKWRALLTSGIVAVGVASPFLYVIVLHYGMRVVNPAPMAGGPWLTASAVRLPELLASNAPLIALAAGGMLVLRAPLLRTWLIASLILTLYGIWSDIEPTLPRVVPTLHFWRYIGPALTVYAGAATWWCARRIARERAPLTVSAAAMLATVLLFPAYLARPDFWGRDLVLQRSPDHPQLSEQLRDIARGQVVLAPTRVSLEVVGPGWNSSGGCRSETPPGRPGWTRLPDRFDGKDLRA